MEPVDGTGWMVEVGTNSGGPRSFFLAVWTAWHPRKVYEGGNGWRRGSGVSRDLNCRGWSCLRQGWHQRRVEHESGDSGDWESDVVSVAGGFGGCREALP